MEREEIASMPVDEYRQKYLLALAFPYLFPTGKGDIFEAIPELEGNKLLRMNQFDLLDRLLRHSYIDDKGKVRRPFDEDRRFAYYVYNILLRR